ncbi:mandelate racemase/muconate lactonizing enzyme family protein [Acerihabitans sp.]|uniref:mandelate racemase/muconate lactonizing enzyme family protein n=1 Tax=Acerihabitans sp. TaxID=2811394 RepID=UPI002EDA3898
MKITQVEVLHIHEIATDGHKGQRPVLVRIDTDAGIYGLGEVGLAYGSAGRAAFGIIQDLARHIIGKDPFNIEGIWETLFKETFWGQGGGAVIFGGISGIDIALWDIKGKALGVPVYQLLGGKTRDKIRSYASQIQLGWSSKRVPAAHPEEYAANARTALNAGFDAVKVDVIMFDKLGKSVGRLEGPLPQATLRLARDRVKAIREEVGPDVDIIIENHARTDITSSIQLAKAIEEFAIFYYEEINTPLNPKLHKLAKEKINIPIASGERIYSRWGFLPFLTDRSLDVVQPDLGTSGGLSEVKKISELAHIYESTVQVHIAGSGVIAAAALHLEAAIPNFIIHEHHQKTLIPGYIELCEHNYQPVSGHFAVPELPGIGQELTKTAYQKADRITIK